MCYGLNTASRGRKPVVPFFFFLPTQQPPINRLGGARKNLRRDSATILWRRLQVSVASIRLSVALIQLSVACTHLSIRCLDPSTLLSSIYHQLPLSVYPLPFIHSSIRYLHLSVRCFRPSICCRRCYEQETGRFGRVRASFGVNPCRTALPFGGQIT